LKKKGFASGGFGKATIATKGWLSLASISTFIDNRRWR
jgi:hypothetical protein